MSSDAVPPNQPSAAAKPSGRSFWKPKARKTSASISAGALAPRPMVSGVPLRRSWSTPFEARDPGT